MLARAMPRARGLASVIKMTAVQLWHCYRVPDVSTHGCGVVKWAAPLENGKWFLFSDGVPEEDEPLNGIVTARPKEFGKMALCAKNVFYSSYCPGPAIEIDGVETSEIERLLEQGYRQMSQQEYEASGLGPAIEPAFKWIELPQSLVRDMAARGEIREGARERVALAPHWVAAATAASACDSGAAPAAQTAVDIAPNTIEAIAPEIIEAIAPDRIEAMKLAELKTELRSRNLKVSGSKAELRKRLLAATSRD